MGRSSSKTVELSEKDSLDKVEVPTAVKRRKKKS